MNEAHVLHAHRCRHRFCLKCGKQFKTAHRMTQRMPIDLILKEVEVYSVWSCSVVFIYFLFVSWWTLLLRIYVSTHGYKSYFHNSQTGRLVPILCSHKPIVGYMAECFYVKIRNKIRPRTTTVIGKEMNLIVFFFPVAHSLYLFAFRT